MGLVIVIVKYSILILHIFDRLVKQTHHIYGSVNNVK